MNCPDCGGAAFERINDYTVDVQPFGVIRYQRRKCRDCGRVYICKGRVEEETPDPEGDPEGGAPDSASADSEPAETEGVIRDEEQPNGTERTDGGGNQEEQAPARAKANRARGGRARKS